MNKRIMLIDDSVTIHRVIDLCVDKDKYEVFKSFSADDAMLRLKSDGADIVLLDNKLEGIKVENFVKQIKETCDAWVVLLIGAFDKFGDDELEKSSADDYLGKPFDAQSLESKITFGSESHTAPEDEELAFDRLAETTAKIEKEAEPEDEDVPQSESADDDVAENIVTAEDVADSDDISPKPLDLEDEEGEAVLGGDDDLSGRLVEDIEDELDSAESDADAQDMPDEVRDPDLTPDFDFENTEEDIKIAEGGAEEWNDDELDDMPLEDRLSILGRGEQEEEEGASEDVQVEEKTVSDEWDEQEAQSTDEQPESIETDDADADAGELDLEDIEADDTQDDASDEDADVDADELDLEDIEAVDTQDDAPDEDADVDAGELDLEDIEAVDAEDDASDEDDGLDDDDFDFDDDLKDLSKEIDSSASADDDILAELSSEESVEETDFEGLEEQEIDSDYDADSSEDFGSLDDIEDIADYDDSESSVLKSLQDLVDDDETITTDVETSKDLDDFMNQVDDALETVEEIPEEVEDEVAEITEQDDIAVDEDVEDAVQDVSLPEDDETVTVELEEDFADIEEPEQIEHVADEPEEAEAEREGVVEGDDIHAGELKSTFAPDADEYEENVTVQVNQAQIQKAVRDVLDSEFFVSTVKTVLEDKLRKVINEVLPDLTEKVVKEELDKLLSED